MSSEEVKKKRVVIVGFSYAGFMIASSIWDHVSVTVIDKREYFEVITASVKGAVDHPLLDDMFAMNDKTAAAYQKLAFK